MEKDPDRKKAKLNEKSYSVDYPREEIETYLPNLAEELKNTPKEPIEIQPSPPTREIRSHKEIEQAVKSHYESDSELYSPSTTDFLRRCSTLEEAEEIINHQLKMNEINEKQAATMKSRKK